MNNQKDLILSESYKDFYNDIQELKYIVNSSLFYLQKAQTELHKHKKDLRARTYIYQETLLNNFTNEQIQLIRELYLLQKKTNDLPHSREQLRSLVKEKNTYIDLIRMRQQLVGAYITASDWQSPSYKHTEYSQAGVKTGTVIGTMNDYKRDIHFDEKEYIQIYKKERIESPMKFGINLYMVNSGMAAFSTIFHFLLSEQKIRGKVLIGKHIYFQNKHLLAKTLRQQILEVDESDTECILSTIMEEKPRVVVLDSLCNSKEIPVPDLKRIISTLINISIKDTYLIIDNTCLPSFQPFKHVVGKTQKVHLIVLESLIKYQQLGLDRTTAGIIATYGKDTGKIYEYRKHAGSIVTDASVYALPLPNKKIFEERLQRYERNAHILASQLEDFIVKEKVRSIKRIIYPGLPSHASYSWFRTSSFHGSFFVFDFQKTYLQVQTYQHFIDTVLREAKKEHIEIIAGTSFGFATTRIYLTSLWTKFGEPFVRVAVGTENRDEIERIAEVFKKAIKKFDSSLKIRLKIR